MVCSRTWALCSVLAAFSSMCPGMMKISRSTRSTSSTCRLTLLTASRIVEAGSITPSTLNFFILI
jgi:hypothetical protein